MFEHHLIFIPGLSGVSPLFEKTAKSWSRFGFTVHVFPIVWKDNNDFEPKLKQLLKLIDNLDDKVSIIGTSAGGSMAMNAFIKRKNKIHKVVNVCGRLRTGENIYPTLEKASKHSKSFKQSVEQCEKELSTLDKNLRKKIMTTSAIFDEIVPTSTITIKGATNIKLFSIEHMLTISLALTLYSNRIVRFLN